MYVLREPLIESFPIEKVGFVWFIVGDKDTLFQRRAVRLIAKKNNLQWDGYLELIYRSIGRI